MASVQLKYCVYSFRYVNEKTYVACCDNEADAKKMILYLAENRKKSFFDRFSDKLFFTYQPETVVIDD